MNYRTSIAQGLVDYLIAELDGSQPDRYFTNMYGLISRNVYKFEEINEFPYIGIHIGPESFQYEPSRQQWVFLDLGILIYVKNEEGDVAMQLEKLIADVKTAIDKEMDLHYTINKPDGTTFNAKVTQITMNSVSTDEGLLDPYGFAEVSITCRYTPITRNI